MTSEENPLKSAMKTQYEQVSDVKSFNNNIEASENMEDNGNHEKDEQRKIFK